MNPKLASDLLALTKGSMKLYTYFLQQQDVETGRAVAAAIASIGRRIAKYLESIEYEIEMICHKSERR